MNMIQKISGLTAAGAVLLGLAGHTNEPDWSNMLLVYGDRVTEVTPDIENHPGLSYLNGPLNLPTRPFLLDWREVTCGEGINVIPNGDQPQRGCQYKQGNMNKPARMNPEPAYEYCQKIGKSMPTVEQWVLAATNLGQNRYVPLAGDSIYDTAGSKLTHVDGKGSRDANDVQALNVDAIGTIGMTGNRVEYAYRNENGRRVFYQCGGDYKGSASRVTFDQANLCTSNRSEWFTWKGMPSGTVRCVIEVTGNSFNHEHAVDEWTEPSWIFKDYALSRQGGLAVAPSEPIDFSIQYQSRIGGGGNSPIDVPEMVEDEGGFDEEEGDSTVVTPPKLNPGGGADNSEVFETPEDDDLVDEDLEDLFNDL